MTGSLGKRIAQMMDLKDIKQEPLAELLHVDQSMISYYVNDKKRPGYEILTKMAKTFDVTTDYLLLGISSLKAVPLVGMVHAGQATYADEEIETWIGVKQDLNADYALRIRGDCMVGAGVNEGDIVICKRAFEASSGQMVVVLINGDEAVLRYLIYEDETWKLRAANSHYLDIIVGPEDDRIRGIVVEIQKSPPSYNELPKKEDWEKVADEATRYGVKAETIKKIIKSIGEPDL